MSHILSRARAASERASVRRPRKHCTHHLRLERHDLQRAVIYTQERVHAREDFARLEKSAGLVVHLFYGAESTAQCHRREGTQYASANDVPIPGPYASANDGSDSESEPPATATLPQKVPSCRRIGLGVRPTQRKDRTCVRYRAYSRLHRGAAFCSECCA